MNDKGDSSTPPICGQYTCVTHTNTHPHIHMGPSGREHYHSILRGEKTRGSFSDECYKDRNPVKGDTQLNMEMHRYRGEWRGQEMT